jgi:hypothetical protein
MIRTEIRDEKQIESIEAHQVVANIRGKLKAQGRWFGPLRQVKESRFLEKTKDIKSCELARSHAYQAICVSSHQHFAQTISPGLH